VSPWLSELFLSSQSDERLVRLARDGHQQAFAAIVERYGRELTRFASRLCSDGRAEDVVQQTFLSAFAALQSDSQVKHLRGWLYTVLRHHAARGADRSHGQSQPLEMATAGESLEESVGQRMFAFDALSEIGRLPDRQRAALVATALEGRSRAEVAGRLGLSEGAVRQLVHRARSTVRAAVTAITPFPLLRWLVPRPSQGADWNRPELVAGAGGASAGAVAVKIGAVVVAGLGVAGAIAVRPQANHRHHAIPAASAASGRGSSWGSPAGTPGGATLVRTADVTGGVAGAGAGVSNAAAGVTGAGAGPGRAAGAAFTGHDDGGGSRSGGGDGGRGPSGSDGSGGGDHGGSGVSSSDGGGSSSGSSGGSDGGGTSSGTSGGSDGGGTSSGTSGGSDGGGSVSSGSGTSGSGGSDGGTSTSGSDGGSGGSTSSTSGSSDGGGTSSGGSDGGLLSGNSTTSTDSSGG